MAKDFSFDVVSDFDPAEMTNAVDQAQRELLTRYDFKGTAAKLEFADGKTGVQLEGESQNQLTAILDVLKLTKLIRDEFPKAKTQIQGDSVRVSSASKDDLQGVMALLRAKEFDFPLDFQNYR